MRLSEISEQLNAKAPTPTNPSKGRVNSLVEVIDQLIESFCLADQEERDAASALLNAHAQVALQNYAWLKAEHAVRHKSEEMVRQGLVALVIENAEDPRHDVVIIAVLFRSAQRLKLDAQAVFGAVADFATNEYLKLWMHGFPSRSLQHSDLEKAFHVHESFNKYGFCYERGPWTIRRKIWEKLRRLSAQVAARTRRDIAGPHSSHTLV